MSGEVESGSGMPVFWASMGLDQESVAKLSTDQIADRVQGLSSMMVGRANDDPSRLPPRAHDLLDQIQEISGDIIMIANEVQLDSTGQ